MPADATATSSTAPPKVWIVTGYRAGERNQILGLAEALDWPFEIKALRYRRWDWLPGLTRMASLTGITASSARSLTPPWPDLVISAGMRNEPVCRWIKARSAGHTRLVQLGRPWVHYRHLDLVITTPQYRLPERREILHNTGTLHRVGDSTLAAAAERWRARFADLPRPWIGVIAGGHSGPLTFGASAGRRLARVASRRARRAGGSLLVTTSSRTPPAAADAMRRAIDVPHLFHAYGGDAGDNPYFGILALADELIVTSDSVAMLSEAVAAGKPLHIFDLDGGENPDRRLAASCYRLLMRFGHPRLTRDVGLFHEALIDSGRAAWLADDAAPRAPTPLADVERAVKRVQELLASWSAASKSPSS